jgi:hypothetical protein
VETQRRREQEESLLAAGTTDGEADPAEQRAHSRRSEKAAYLRAKLEQRARSEDDADDDDGQIDR